MTKKQKAFYDYLQKLKTEEREGTRFVETAQKEFFKYWENCGFGNCAKKCILADDDCKTFKDGAEFGYNKAKEEWKKHFMQCSSPFCLDIFSSVKCYGELGNMAKKEGEEK